MVTLAMARIQIAFTSVVVILPQREVLLAFLRAKPRAAKLGELDLLKKWICFITVHFGLTGSLRSVFIGGCLPLEISSTSGLGTHLESLSMMMIVIGLVLRVFSFHTY